MLYYPPQEQPKLAFTANAFVHCLQEYGESLFQLVKKHGKLYVCERALCEHPEVDTTSLTADWLKVLLNHWFDILDPPHREEYDEMASLVCLDSFYPDNVIVVVDKLREYSRLNRTYANDELITTEQLYNLIMEAHDVK